jgi:hypothetical protein
MKQNLLTVLTIVLAFIAFDSANGQSNKTAKASKAIQAKKELRPRFNHNNATEYPIFPFAPVNPLVTANSNREIPTEVIIGATYYDLQTNNSIPTRILNNSDGSLSATWTTSNEDNTSWANRGMAYHQRINGVWTKLPAYADASNVERIEPVRTGFGSIGRVSGVGDIIIAHQTAIDALQISRNVNLDGENWIFQEETAQPLLWPRLAVGGQDGKTVHSIAVTVPTGGTFTGSPYQGMNGALIYNRSTNGGQTFDQVMRLLPGVDSLNFDGFGGDSYAIDAKGNTVAIVAGNTTSKVTLWKSDDNGQNWTNRTVNPFPEQFTPWTNNYITDLDGDGDVDSIGVTFSYDTTIVINYDTTLVIDTTQIFPPAPDTVVTISSIDTIVVSTPLTWELERIQSNDGTFSVLIDNNDVVHVWFGNMFMSDDDATDESTNYYPGTNGIMYWNESFAADELPVQIAGAMDDNGSGELEVNISFTGVTPNVTPYGAGLSSFVSSGIDDDGTIYLSYVATKEGDAYVYAASSTNPSLRHIYVTKSSDGGATWSEPVDVVGREDLFFDQFAEYAFPSIARRVDNNIHMVYQRDFIPGSAVTIANANVHEYGSNDIVYYGLSKGLTDVGITKVEKNVLALNLVPNPANETATLSFDVATAGNVNVTVTNILGQNILNVANTNALPGKQSIAINTADLANGIYIVNVINGNNKSSKKLVVKH